MDKGDTRVKTNRKMRKPLVEKKRRARINQSLQELRALIADHDMQSKMENAEVLEVTVKQVESILQNRAQDVSALNREASERFAAGYVQCMHDVHTFVSGCPGMDTTVAAELLNRLLENMPLNDELLEMPPVADIIGSDNMAPASFHLPSNDDTSSDLDETDSEQNHVSCSEDADNQHDGSSHLTLCNKLWRPCNF